MSTARLQEMLCSGINVLLQPTLTVLTAST